MNGRQAKKLRGMAGFHPHGRRLYKKRLARDTIVRYTKDGPLVKRVLLPIRLEWGARTTYKVLKTKFKRGEITE